MTIATLLPRFLGREMAPRLESWATPVRTNGAIVARLARSALQLTHAIFSRRLRRCVLMQGPFLLYRSGAVTISQTGVLKRAVTGAGRREPFVLFRGLSGADAGLARLCAVLELDPSDTLSGTMTAQQVLIVLGRHQGLPVVAKLSGAEAGEAYLIPQQRSLQWFADNGAPRPLAGLVPRVVAHRRGPDHCVLVQTRLPGAPTDLGTVTDEEFSRRMELAAALLGELHRLGSVDDGGVTAEFLDRLSRLPDIYADYGEPLARAVSVLRDWAADRRLPVVLVHGDYQLRNILFQDVPLRVSGIIDWDRFRPQGWPMLDALHLAVSSIAHRRQETFGPVLAEIWNADRRSPLMARHLDHVAALLGVDLDALQHAAIALWLNYLWYRHEDGVVADPHWVRMMTEEPAREIGQWLAKADRRNQIVDRV